MIKTFAVFAAVAALSVTGPVAQAGTKKKIDHRLTAVSIGVGAGATAGYFAFDDWSLKWRGVHGVTSLGAWGLTTVGCAALSPIVATAVLNRPLTFREAHILVANCVIPVVGGWLVNEAHNEGIWQAPDEKPPRKVVQRRKR